VLAFASEAEAAAEDDRPVRPREVELVQRLCVEVRRLEPLTNGALTGKREHVG
jgi:hypothetical protein